MFKPIPSLLALFLVVAAPAAAQPTPAPPRISAEEVAAASASNAARPDLKATAACAAKNGEACTQIGLMLMNGAPNVTRDDAAAAGSFRRACDLGHGPGCRALGMALQSGRGLAIDLPGAQAAYLKACAANDGGGCGRAGAMYLNGQGGVKDVPKGLSYLTRACDLGQAPACASRDRLAAKP